MVFGELLRRFWKTNGEAEAPDELRPGRRIVIPCE